MIFLQPFEFFGKEDLLSPLMDYVIIKENFIETVFSFLHELEEMIQYGFDGEDIWKF